MRRLLVALLLIPLLAHAEPEELDWLDLLPPEDLEALENMPEIEHQGAEADSPFYVQGGLKQQQGLPEVMYSTRTVAALDGQELRLGGYPVPLESDAQGRFHTFFLVPYPGPASMCRRRRRTRSYWCVTRAASPWTTSTCRCG